MNHMIHPGLVSVTFRSMRPEKIVNLAVQAGLHGIEWGGDVHVPHGDITAARTARKLTEESGLSVAAYGSYYRVGYSESANEGSNEVLRFDSVLETACELGAASIRVWAGAKGSDAETVVGRRAVIEDAARIAAMAGHAGIALAYEYHSHTLMDSVQSAQWLLEETAPQGMRTLWQPVPGDSAARQISSLSSLLPWLLNLHVYHWQEQERRPLIEGKDAWLDLLRWALQTGRDHWALLEFVQDDCKENFLRDAATLCKWLEDVNS